MKRAIFAATPELSRRDTLGTRTIVRCDPRAPRPTTSVMVGKYVVARRPLPDSVHTLYMVMDGAEVVGTSISYPSEGDCASFFSRRKQQRAAALTASAIEKAKKRKPRALRIKEAA
jgi:hypothetical protein